MVEKVIWSISARNDLEEIYLSLENYSSPYAENWLNEVFDRIALLEKFPEMGRTLPQREISFVREVFIGNYRLVYSFLNKQLTILRIKHSSSPLGRI